MLLFQIFTTLFPIFTIITLGYLYTHLQAIDVGIINQVNMAVFIPALIFSALSGKNIAVTDYYHLILGGVAIILGSGMLLLPVALWCRFKLRTFIPPMMFLNAGNMGMPVIIFSFGEAALPVAVMLFVLMATFQFTLGFYLISRQTFGWYLLKSPIIVATGAGLTVSLMTVEFPPFLLKPIHLLGQASIPLTLFSLGARLSNIDLTYWRIGLLGALLRPLTGITVFLLISPWLTLSPLQTGALLTFSALPPGVVNYAIAEQFQQEASKVAAIVMLGNATSVLSLPLVLAFALPLSSIPA